MALPLDETISPGQLHHDDDHETIAEWINDADATLTSMDEFVEHNVELVSVEKTDTDWTTTATAATDITGMVISFTVTTRPVYVFFGASDMSHSVSGTLALLYLTEDVTETIMQFFRGTVAGTNYRIPLGSSHVRLSTPGSYTFKLQTASGGAGTLKVYCTANNPIFLRAVEM